MLIVNPELEKKKQELKQLENKYQSFVIKRDELLNDINNFNDEYNLKFGELLEQILSLKEENIYKKIELKKLKKDKLLNDKNLLKKLQEKEYKIQAEIDKLKLELRLNGNNDLLLQKKEELEIALKEIKEQIEFIEREKEIFQKEEAQKNIDDLEDELNDAKNDKKEFDEEMKETENVQELQEEEKIELKNLYRKLSKMIHPDVVDKEHKSQAQELMSELNELYRYKKLEQIKKLYIQVSKNNFISISDKLDEIDEIQKRIYLIKDKIVEILKELDEIKANEIFDIIKNKDEYFNSIQESLMQKLSDLKIERSYLDINIMKYQDW